MTERSETQKNAQFHRKWQKRCQIVANPLNRLQPIFNVEKSKLGEKGKNKWCFFASNCHQTATAKLLEP